MTFDEIMAPLGAETFLRDYLGQQPLHLQGAADKFHDVMNWDALNRLLGTTSVWTPQTMMLILDRETLPPTSYATMVAARNGGSELRPDPVRVQQYLARGATMVLNFIDQLTPELSDVARSLERALGGTVQANLYLSSKRKQGFNAHFDFHDVFAMHVMGEKTWTVFKGRCEWPIQHPMFEGWSRERHDQHKGELWREVTLKPGDLLYLPRGQYHYALADDGPCVHIAWGVTYPIGMDAVSYAFERMVGETVGRANLPRDRAQLQARLAEIGRLIAQKLTEPQAVDDMARTWERLGAGRHDERRPQDIDQLPGLHDSPPRLLYPELDWRRLHPRGCSTMAFPSALRHCPVRRQSRCPPSSCTSQRGAAPSWSMAPSYQPAWADRSVTVRSSAARVGWTRRNTSASGRFASIPARCTRTRLWSSENSTCAR